MECAGDVRASALSGRRQRLAGLGRRPGRPTPIHIYTTITNGNGHEDPGRPRRPAPDINCNK